MTNFDFLRNNPQYTDFADIAISAEKILPIDPSAAVLNCRRAMEFAVKWMYSVDRDLQKPWDDKLISLMSTDEFRDIVDLDTFRRMDYIRKAGNLAAHGGRKITRDQAELCLKNLFFFFDFLTCCYSTDYIERKYDPSLLNNDVIVNEKVDHLLTKKLTTSLANYFTI